MRERALVLGGGGSSGNAWLIGVVAGLFDAGLDVTAANLIVGTSGGSTTAAQITGVTPPQLLAGILSAAPPERPGMSSKRVVARPATNHVERTSQIIDLAE